MEKVLISGCLLGENVRYDGGTQRLLHPLIQQLKHAQCLVSVCPEVLGGLPIPRPAAEICLQSQKILTQNKIDVTESFNLGAKSALALCKKYGIRFALLKESSPSCGSSMVYDGSFSNKKIAGQGITTQLLRENGVQVFSELTVEKLVKLLEC